MHRDNLAIGTKHGGTDRRSHPGNFTAPRDPVKTQPLDEPYRPARAIMVGIPLSLLMWVGIVLAIFRR